MAIDLDRIMQTEQKLRTWSHMPDFPNIPPSAKSIEEIGEAVLIIAQDTKTQYPIISKELEGLRHQLFQNNGMGVLFINPCVLGQIVEALSILDKEIHNNKENMWDLIHPRISKCSRKLFEDGSYINSTVDAFIEINDRLKSIYKILKPSATEIPDGVDLMHKLLGGKPPMLPVGELESESGKNIQEGTHFMMAGAISALRNPKSHSNEVQISKNEAIRRLMFASMLMNRIDEAVVFSNISE